MTKIENVITSGVSKKTGKNYTMLTTYIVVDNNKFRVGKPYFFDAKDEVLFKELLKK
jgi:hypothetical protein